MASAGREARPLSREKNRERGGESKERGRDRELEREGERRTWVTVRAVVAFTHPCNHGQVLPPPSLLLWLSLRRWGAIVATGAAVAVHRRGGALEGGGRVTVTMAVRV